MEGEWNRLVERNEMNGGAVDKNLSINFRNTRVRYANATGPIGLRYLVIGRRFHSVASSNEEEAFWLGPSFWGDTDVVCLCVWVRACVWVRIEWSNSRHS